MIRTTVPELPWTEYPVRIYCPRCERLIETLRQRPPAEWTIKLLSCTYCAEDR